MKKRLFCLALLGLFATPLFAAQMIISKPEVYLQDSLLTAAFEVQAHLAEKEKKTLQSGLTTTIKIQVELWEKGGLLRRLKAIKELRREISFDIWEKIYTLVKSEKEEPMQLENYQELEQALAEKEVVSLLSLQSLSSAQKYFIRVRVAMESINKREIKEIKEWVDGSGGLINIGNILAFLVKQQSKGQQLHAQSDYFTPSTLARKK